MTSIYKDNAQEKMLTSWSVQLKAENAGSSVDLVSFMFLMRV